MLAGPDWSPKRVETIDGLSETVPLLSPRRTISCTPEPSVSSAWPSAFLSAKLVFSHFCLPNRIPLVFITFLFFKCRKTDEVFLKPPPFLRQEKMSLFPYREEK